MPMRLIVNEAKPREEWHRSSRTTATDEAKGMMPSGASSVGLQDLVHAIISAIVDYPEAVEITQVDGETASALEIRVAPQDIKKVIGWQGRTIAAIRTLVRAAGAKEHKHMLLEVVEGRSIIWQS